jgi:hypothetical protein
MNAYANPSARSIRDSIAEEGGHVDVGAAATVGAIIAASFWTLYGLVVMLFGLFGIDLFATIAQAQIVIGNAVTSFDAVYAPVFTYLIGIVANVILGAIAGAFAAWLNNLFTE